MNYLDYREKLGIGFADEQKAKMLGNRIDAFIKSFRYTGGGYPPVITDICEKYFMAVSEKLPAHCYALNLSQSITSENSVSGVVSKYIVFANNARKSNELPDDIKRNIDSFIIKCLDDLHIRYARTHDADGIFVFPNGAKELDDALVSEPLEWLSDYEKTHKAFILALKAYSNAAPNDASNIADDFRKALETFFQEFFNSKKSLENLKSEYGDYLKQCGIPTEVANDFSSLLKSYTDFMNNNAKHHDNTPPDCLEYIMYQTGNIIRLLISLKRKPQA